MVEQEIRDLTVKELYTIADRLKEVPAAQRNALLDLLTQYCRLLDVKEQMLRDLKLKAKE